MKSSLPNGNVALPTSCVSTAVSGFGYFLHSHSLPVGKVMKNHAAGARHGRMGCRCVCCKGSCVSYGPKLANVCSLTQGPKKSIIALAASGGGGVGGGVQVTFQREITSVAHRFLCSQLTASMCTGTSPDRVT